MYYVHTDHLGSLNVITNESDAIEQEISYDAWGNRRDPATLQNYTTAPAGLITDRGFTGHEHLDAFKLINVNGRIYDPALGRFLSPDNYVQDAGSTQDYNRYSYCGNSPLMFTDPSGFIKYQAPMPTVTLPLSSCYIGGGGRGSDQIVFPKYGVLGAPTNDLGYDIQLGHNIGRTTGDWSYLNSVKEGSVSGYYNGRNDGLAYNIRTGNWGYWKTFNIVYQARNRIGVEAISTSIWLSLSHLNPQSSEGSKEVFENSEAAVVAVALSTHNAEEYIEHFAKARTWRNKIYW